MKKIIILFFVICYSLFSTEAPFWHLAGFSSDITILGLKQCLPDKDFNKIFAVGGPGVVNIIDTKTGSLIGILNKEDVGKETFKPIQYIGISPDGKNVCTNDLDVWSVDNGEILYSFDLPEDKDLKIIQYSDDGKYIFIVNDEKKIYKLNTEDHTAELVYTNPDRIECLKTCSKDKYIYFSDESGMIYLYDHQDKSMFKKIDFVYMNSDIAITVSKSGKYIYAHRKSGIEGKIYDIDSNKILLDKESFWWGTDTQFTNDEKYLITYVSDSVRFVNILTGNSEKSYFLRLYPWDPFFLHISPDGKKLLANNYYQSLLYNLNDSSSIPVSMHYMPTHAILNVPGSDYVITADYYSNSMDFHLILNKYNYKIKKLIWNYGDSFQKLPDDYYYLYDYHPMGITDNGKILIQPVWDDYLKKNVIMLMDAVNGKKIKSLNLHNGVITWLKITDNGQYFYSSGTDSTIVKYSLESDSQIDKYHFPDKVFAFSVYNNKIFALTGNLDRKSLLEYDLSSGKIKKIRDLYIEYISRITPYTISKNGRFLASYVYDENKVALIDFENPDAISYIGGPGQISAIKMSPDSKYIATALEDKNILNIWDITSNEMVFSVNNDYLCRNVQIIYNRPPIIYSIEFTDNDRNLIFGNNEPSLLFYELEPLNVKKTNINKSDCKAYPNPCSEYLNIELPFQNDPVEPVVLFYDILGKKVPLDYIITRTGKNLKIKVKINLKPGLYLYSIFTRSNTFNGSFTVF